MDNTVEYNFKPIVQGAYWEVTMEFSVNGTVVDLTNYTAKMDIRDAPYSNANLILSLTTTGSAGITITGASGLITLFITSAQSSLFTLDTLYYDLHLTNTVTSRVSVPFRGKITVIPKVTA